MDIKLTEKDRVEYIPDDELFCDVCGMTYKKFLETGQFGCPNCYHVFKSRTVDKLKHSMLETEKPKVDESIENNTQVVQVLNEKSIKERIAELKHLLKLCYELGEKDKAFVIEKEIKILEEKEK